jgi:hypothetical protein
VAGTREDTLVMHQDHTEAMLMNILIEIEMWLMKLENELKRLAVGGGDIVSSGFLDTIPIKIFE